MFFPIFFVLIAFAPFPAKAQTVPTPTRAPATTRHYAVTLLTSFEPIPDALMPADIKNQRVYRTDGVVFGKNIYFVRVGFFATPAEATTARDGLVARYPGAFMTEVSEDEFRAASPRHATTSERPAPRKPSEPVATREELYVVTLAFSSTLAPKPQGPLPVELKGKRMYRRDGMRDGAPLYSLQLGFFTNVSEAETAARLLIAIYPQARVQPITEQERNESSRTVVAVPGVTTASKPDQSVLPTSVVNSSVEKQASEFLERSRDALTGGNNVLAIQLLTQLLQLPPNAQSQDAQELIGLAHERNGEIEKAKREYALCLKLYPNWSGAERVRQRLAELETTSKTPALVAPKKKEINISTAYGSFSQYYYRGNSHVDTILTPLVGPPEPQPTLTSLDQSQLITNLDLTGRFRSGDYDNRIVIRNSYSLNFLPDTENDNRLFSAYGEVRNKVYDYSGRIGRQPGNSGGVLGRFDGLSVGYGLVPKWRVNLVAGVPVEFNPINSDKQFWGTSLDYGTFREHWSGSTYYISQAVDGIVDRQAVGTELRYFDPRRSFLSLVDYDVSYGVLNIALLQGTVQMGNNTSLNLLVDHRLSPILQTSNALINETNTSISSFLQLGMTEEQLRAQAEDRTPTSDLIMLGVTHNFNPSWQVGGDVKVYNISGTPASGTPPATPIPATADTGNVYVYTLQGIATGLLTKRDVTVLSLSTISSDTYDGKSIALNNRTILWEKWTIDFSLRHYQQQDTAGTEQTRLTPILRVGYRWRDRVTFEAEAGLEKAQTTSGSQMEDSSLSFYTIGYRWDF